MAARRSESTHPEHIATMLRRGIRDSVLKPGQSLIQEELAGRFGVSRGPLREALWMLAAEGLVTIVPGYGAVVTSLDPAEITELYDIRIALETELAGAITDRIRPSEVDEFDGYVTGMDRAIASGTPQVWSDLNFRFHRRMYEIAARPHSLRIITQLLSLVEPYSRAYVHGMKTYDRVQSEHHAMVHALRDRNRTALADLIRTHLGGAQRGLVENLANQDAPEDPLKALRGLTS